MLNSAMSDKPSDIHSTELESIEDHQLLWVHISVTIIASSLRTISHLMTLEALCYYYEIKPSLNTEDENRSRALVINI